MIRDLVGSLVTLSVHVLRRKHITIDLSQVLIPRSSVEICEVPQIEVFPSACTTTKLSSVVLSELSHQPFVIHTVTDCSSVCY